MPEHSNKKVALCQDRAQSWWRPSQAWETRVECRWHEVVAQKCSGTSFSQESFAVIFDATSSHPRSSHPRSNHLRSSHLGSSYLRSSHPRNSHLRSSHQRKSHPKSSDLRTSHPKSKHPRSNHPRSSQLCCNKE